MCAAKLNKNFTWKNSNNWKQQLLFFVFIFWKFSHRHVLTHTHTKTPTTSTYEPSTTNDPSLTALPIWFKSTINTTTCATTTATRTGSHKFVHSKFATRLQRDRSGGHAIQIWPGGVHKDFTWCSNEFKR